jgi:hypothetical protein
MSKDKGRLKSAYELAVERMGGIEESPLGEEQKAKLAEIRRRHESKVAEKKIVLERQIAEARQAGDAETMQKLQEELTAALAALREESEREEKKVRQGKA